MAVLSKCATELKKRTQIPLHLNAYILHAQKQKRAVISHRRANIRLDACLQILNDGMYLPAIFKKSIKQEI